MTETLSTQHQPIAIIGMGCRFPGGIHNLQDFWQMLVNGQDALGDIPGNRWDIDAYHDPEMSVPGKIYVRQGYYLDEIDTFDPQFFRISPREAESLDPQQRLLLEVSWEALENATIAPDRLKGSQTGIFVGQYWDDYSMQRIYGTAPAQIDRYAQLSSLRGLSAGRIAHTLDVNGPTMQVDTACSSALLAVQLACQSLQTGDSDLALAGGVNLVLAPQHLIGICQMKALAPDGRCKTFDAKADGFGQGEGCGMVVLKRLADAEQDGDPILAVIRGTAVNHDGHSRTVTTPNGPAQRAMLQQALDDGGIDPHDVGYVEAHGTGTSLGDPIEFLALARVLCQERDRPLYIGSVKTNIGHLDSAAGIAGLMKIVLALQHGIIPPQPNFDEPNPRIPWNEWPVQVPVESTPWPIERKLAGVSAFGMSGTNVHLIVEAAPEPISTVVEHSTERSRRSPVETARPLHLLPLSARDPETLGDQAQAYLHHLKTAPASFADMAFTATTGRAHFNQRLAVVAESTEATCDALTSYLKSELSPWLFATEGKTKRPKIAFLFTGQGAQYAGMGQRLYETQPTFRFWLDRCAELLAPHLDKPLLDILYPATADESVHQTIYTQPALFAIEYALAQLWLSWGIEPDVMMGHSVGEYVAACLADVFSLEDGLALIATRGRLMQSLPAGGEMVSVMADEATVAAQIEPYLANVSIAAINGPNSIVISGEGSILQQAVAALQTQGIKTKQLVVSHAFHSPQMDPILEEFAQVARQINYAPPTRPLVSNVTGQMATEDLFTAEYWVNHLRQAVRFAHGMTTLQEQKINAFIEIGPKPILLGMGRGCLPPEYGTWYPSLRPETEWPTLLTSAAQLYTQGAEIDWTGFEQDYAHQRRKVLLPTYPWRRQRYWTDVNTNSQSPTTNNQSTLHPLLHQRLALASQQHIFESYLSTNEPAYLVDHRSFDTVLLPASAYLEMVLTAGNQLWGHDQLQISDLSIQQALILTEERSQVQLVITPEQQAYHFELFSLAKSAEGAAENWIRHATGRIEQQEKQIDFPTDLATLQQSYPLPTTPQALNQRFAEIGMTYGPAFQTPQMFYYAEERSERAGLAHMQLPAAARSAGGLTSYRLHPTLLDGCLRMAEALFPDNEDDQLYLPFGMNRLQFFTAPQDSVWVHAVGREQEGTRIVDLHLFDQEGTAVAAIEGLLLRAASVSALQRNLAAAQQEELPLTDWLYTLEWQPKSVQQKPFDGQPATWLIVTDKENQGSQLAGLLQDKGQIAYIATQLADFDRLLEEIGSDGLNGIVQFWHRESPSESPEQNNLQNALTTLHIIQSLDRIRKTAPLYLVANQQTAAFSLARVIQQEQPELACVCVDLGHEEDMAHLVQELATTDGENQIAWREGQRYVARLAPANLTLSERPIEIVTDGTYLITGGLGALGLQMAQHLVAEGARYLLLSGRRGITTEEQQAAIDQLAQQGAQVKVVQADVAEAEDVARLLAQAEKPLRGVIHAAGVLDDGLLLQQSRERFERVAAPKIQGAWHLHTQTLEQPLDFMVFFSSVTSLMGSVGQANYAVANGFMDGLAHQRRAAGLPSLSINWGPWGDVGMAATEQVKRRLAQEGWDTISSEQGWQITKMLLQHETTQVGVLPIDWTRFVQAVPTAWDWPLLTDLTSQLEPAAQTQPATSHGIREKLQLASTEEHPALLVSYLQERAAQALRVSVNQLDEQQSLTHLGIDSLIAVELRSWVRNDLDVDLSLEQLLTAPTISDLATTIHQLITPAQDAPEVVAAPVDSDWVTFPKPNPAAKLRLFCFHYAGGGASVYREWPELLPEEIELCPIQLPGRENRLQETLYTDLNLLIQELLPALHPHLDKPFAFFGHSMGAMISFEVARQLRTTYDLSPCHLFLSAWQAPQIPRESEALRSLSDAEFLELLQKRYGAVPEIILENVALQQTFVPILRADVAMLETHNFQPGPPLSYPITVFGGQGDPSVSEAELAGWQAQTDGAFELQMFAGAHFYLNQVRGELVAAVVAGLGPLYGG